MLQGGPLDKEAITQMLMSSLGAPQPTPQPLDDANRVLYPTEYEPKDLPDAPYRRLLELSQTSETLQAHLNEPTSVLSRLARVSHDFIKGSMLLFNLPSREFQVKYQQSLTLALRFLFTAFSGIYCALHIGT